MIIINSAAYVVPEFRAEFGLIPPCVIPIGNKKLIEYQAAKLRTVFDEKIVVSLPESYDLNFDEISLLAELNVTVAKVPDNLSLGQAILYVINTIGEPSEPLRLLHGDTFLDTMPEALDLIAVAATEDDYIWETETTGTGYEIVWCGFFSFSSPKAFTRALALSGGHFVNAIRAYGETTPLAIQEVNGWHDLGHVNTYFQSRSLITTQRVFNSLKIRNGLVWKSGSPTHKIKAEANWYKSLPAELKKYTPQLIDSGLDKETNAYYYRLEYLPLSPLNEVFVHGRNPDFFWKRIFRLMAGFLSDASENTNTLPTEERSKIVTDTHQLYSDKTVERLQRYAEDSGCDLDAANAYGSVVLPSFRTISDHCIDLANAQPLFESVIHGDFCFSNVLYDSRATALKLIDPRGVNCSLEETIYGDQKYDLAKACHSVIGMYDFIIAGRYEITEDHTGSTIEFNIDERLSKIQQLFFETSFIPGFQTVDIMPLTVLLFLSMLPLHSDRPDRQRAMILNALRLYSNFIHEDTKFVKAPSV
jgi:molybdopterin-guanine dinucleotide biosynthesis protein A